MSEQPVASEEPKVWGWVDSTLVAVEDLTCLEQALAWAADRLARDMAEQNMIFAPPPDAGTGPAATKER